MTVRTHTPTNVPMPERHPPLLATIRRNLSDHQLIPLAADEHPLPLVVGVSGGADSVCLLHALLQLSADFGLEIHVAHLNHSLRPESAEDAGFVASLCRQLGLPYHESTLDAETLKHSPGGLEDGARRARYTFLCRVAYDVAYNIAHDVAARMPANVAGQDLVPTIAVAHNIEDQAETVLLNLVRGSGARGLGGIRWRTKVDWPDQASADPAGKSSPVWLIRPLLNIHRSEIEEYLTQHSLAWREDSSNQDVTFSRNFIRHRILPELAQINPNVIDTLARSAQIVSGDVDRLAAIDRRLLDEIAVADGTAYNSRERVLLDFEKLADLSPSQQRGLLRAAIDQLPGGLYGVDAVAIDRLIEQLQGAAASGRSPSTSGPHPLIGALAWSLVSSSTTARGQEPARLIVHLDSVLPVQPWGPLLDADWTPVALPESGELRIDGWRLIVDRLTVAELPDGWRNVSPWQAWLDADMVDHPVLSRPANGMRVAPLGMGGQTRSLGDLFTDEKIHPSLREGWPLLLDSGANQTAGEQILWVCGLRLGHSARITDNTVHVLALSWELV